MRIEVAAWFASHTSVSADWPIDALLANKGRSTVSVVLPALNEASTVGRIVSTIRDELMQPGRCLVDQLLVLDSGSTDATAANACRAGADVVHGDELLGFPAIPGKGEALWRSLAATTGDIVVFVDADLLAFDASYVTGLLGPLLSDPTISLVKATYDRPLTTAGRVHPGGGGRVTELVARPLINAHWPELAGFVQPLAGEYAGRRSLLERLPFATGYGVEIGLLIDALSLVGLDGLAQVDLGERRHRHHDDQKLGRMAAEIWQTALARLPGEGGRPISSTLTQFVRDGDVYLPAVHDVTALERPPMVEIADYVQSRSA